MTNPLARLQTALSGRYRIERELGGGGMSHVYVAEEEGLGRKVVIKLLPPGASEAVQADRFQREIQVAASLQHPHIVPLLAAGQIGDLLWYSMPFVDGESLADRISRDGTIPATEALRIMSEVADALAAAHARGIVHRDIKPANILLAGRHALVADFGVAKALEAGHKSDTNPGAASLTTVGMTLGTPAYMAPEQAAADPNVDHRADIYALGIVAYEMLTGRLPFSGSTPQALLAAHVTTAPMPIASLRPDLPGPLAALIMRCLAKAPGDRWASAGELVTAIDGLATPSGGMAGLDGYAHRRLRNWGTPRIVMLHLVATVALTALAYGITRVADLPDWIWQGTLGAMLAGLPVVLLAGRTERQHATMTLAGVSGVAPGATSWITGRRAIRGGIIAVATVAVVAGAFLASRAFGVGPGATLRSAGKLGATDKLLLADFDNSTSDTTLAAAVVEALRVDLGQSRAIKLVEPTEVTQLLGLMGRAPGHIASADARELAQRVGAKALVTGEITSLGGGYSLTARVVASDSGNTLASVRESAASPTELLAAVNRLSAALREKIGESLHSIRGSEPLEQVTTASLPALRLYTQGMRLSSLGDTPESLALLEQSVALDSSFAMAWRKIAVVRGNMGLDRSLILDAARRAYRFRDRLPPLERALTEGTYYNNVEIDNDKAIAALRAALSIDPENQTAANNLAVVLNNTGRYVEAEAVLRPAFKPGATRNIALNLTSALVAQHRLAAADSVSDELLRTTGDTGNALYLRAMSSMVVSDFTRSDADVAAALKHLPPGSPRIEQLLTIQATTEKMRGRLTTGQAILEGFAARDISNGNPAAALVLRIERAFTTVFHLQQPAEALKQLDAALTQTPLEKMPPRGRPYGMIAEVYAFASNANGVRQMRKGSDAATPVAERFPGYDPYWDALEAVAAGNWAAAATTMKAAYTEGNCIPCGRYYYAYALDRAGQPDSAIVAWGAALTNVTLNPDFEESRMRPFALLRLGEIYADKGDRRKALEYLQQFTALWSNADGPLQPMVQRAKARIAELTKERP
ncbi:MAG: protein kinase [Gemmatimonadota bacterium]